MALELQLNTGAAQKSLDQIESSLGELRAKLNSFGGNTALETTLTRIAGIRLDAGVTSSLAGLSKALNSLSNVGDLGKVSSSLNALANVNIAGVVGNISALGQALASVRSPPGLSTAAKNIAALAAASANAAAPINGVAVALNQIHAPAGLTGLPNQLRSAAQGSAQLRDAINSVSGVLNGFGIALGGVGLAQFIKGSFDAITVVDQFTNRIKASGDGSLNAGKELDYLKETVKKLALPFGEGARAYSKLVTSITAAGRPVGDARKVFEGFGTVFRVLGLNAEQAGRGFNAVTQIVDKGAVSMEELRQQLGELFPAFTLLASSMGISTKELANLMAQGKVSSDVLFKFADDLTAKFGGQLQNALKTAQAAMTNFSNAILFVQDAFGRGFFEALIPGINALSAALSSPAFLQAASNIGAIAGVILGGLAQAISFFVGNFPMMTAAVVGFLSISFTAKIALWVASLFGFKAAVVSTTASYLASTTVMTAATTRLTAAMGILRSIMAAFSLSSLIAGFAALGPIVGGVVVAALVMLGLAIGSVAAAATTTAQAWELVKQAFLTAASTIASYVIPALQTAYTVVSTLTGILWSMAMFVTTVLSAAFQGWGIILQFVLEKLGMWDAAVAAANAVMSAFAAVVGYVKEAFNGLAMLLGFAAEKAAVLATAAADTVSSVSTLGSTSSAAADGVGKLGKSAADAEFPLLSSAGAIANLSDNAFQLVAPAKAASSSLSDLGRHADASSSGLDNASDSADDASSSLRNVAGAADYASSATGNLASGFYSSGDAADSAANSYDRAADAASRAAQADAAYRRASSDYADGTGAESSGRGFGLINDMLNDSFFDTLSGSGGGIISRSGKAKHFGSASAHAGMFSNAPHYAGGTANTTGNGIPAILHPNEAVIPLTGGGAVPVDMQGTGGAANASSTQLSSSAAVPRVFDDQLTAQRSISLETSRVWEQTQANSVILSHQSDILKEWLVKIHTAIVGMAANIGKSVGTGGGGSSTIPGASGSSTPSAGTVENGGGFSAAERLLSQIASLEDQKKHPIDAGGTSQFYLDSSGKLYVKGYGPDVAHNKSIDAQQSRAISDFAAEYGWEQLPEPYRSYADPNGKRNRIPGTVGFATGSPNASVDANGGFQAVLHPDEAVIPLPDGRRVPVSLPKNLTDMPDRFIDTVADVQRRRGGDFRKPSPTSGSTDRDAPASVTVNMTINTPDVASFRRSQDQIVQELQAKLSRSGRVIGTKMTVEDPTLLARKRETS